MKKTTVIAIALASIAASAGEGVRWGYESASGPAHWGELSDEFALCSEGRNQSPIDLGDAVEAELPRIQLVYSGTTAAVINNGHTLQVDVTPGSALVVAGREYRLLQFHFHAPSEHLLRGAPLPLEAHFVHADADGALAVVSVLFRAGMSDTSLARLWAAAPAEAGGRTPLETPLGELSFLPSELAYAYYNGSLTTPPCSEGVRWFVLESKRHVSAKQVEAFVENVGENARPAQPLGARLLLR
jgi:carbonic anhydrase